jgi:hypothetical protein
MDVLVGKPEAETPLLLNLQQRSALPMALLLSVAHDRGWAEGGSGWPSRRSTKLLPLGGPHAGNSALAGTSGATWLQEMN